MSGPEAPCVLSGLPAARAASRYLVWKFPLWKWTVLRLCCFNESRGKFSVVLGENLFPCTIQPFKLCWHFKQPRNTPTLITLETRLCAGFPPEHGVLEAQWQRVSLRPSLVWLGSQQAVCAALNLCSRLSLLG